MALPNPPRLRKVIAPAAIAAALTFSMCAPASATEVSFNNGSGTITIGEGTFVLDGNLLDFEALKPFLPPLGGTYLSDADKARIAELQAAQKSLESKQDMLAAAKKTHQKAIAALTKKTTELGGLITNLDPETFDAQREDRKESVKQLTAANEKIEAKTKTAKGSMKALKTQKGATKNSLDVLREQAEIFPENEFLADAVTDLDKVVKNIQAALDQTGASIAKDVAQQKKNTAQITEDGKALKELDAAEVIFTDIAKEQKKLDGKAKEFNQVGGKIAANKAKLKALGNGKKIDGYNIVFDGKLVPCKNSKLPACFKGSYKETPLLAETKLPKQPDPTKEKPAQADKDKPAKDKAAKKPAKDKPAKEKKADEKA